MNTRFMLLSLGLLCVQAFLSTSATGSQRRGELARLGEDVAVMPASVGGADMRASIRRLGKMKKCRLQCWVVRSDEREAPRFNCRISCQN